MTALLLALALACTHGPQRAEVQSAGDLRAQGADLDFLAVNGAYLEWQARMPDKQARTAPEHRPAYRFYADMHAEIAPLVAARPGVVTVHRIGSTVQDRPIWAFRVRDPADRTPDPAKVLVFAQIHALEWVPGEVATEFLTALIQRPVAGVEVVVVPVLNVDGRLRAETDIAAGEDKLRRSNANGVDLNRDFAWNRDSPAIWRHIIPNRYTVSPGPLSQPESQAIDRLASEGFDVSVSLHAFGGFIYTPWAGRWRRIDPDDRQEHVRLGTVMSQAQGPHAYRVRQLSRWGFFFRGLGMEVDHMYAEYGATSYLIELTRSGLTLDPATWKSPFRFYNPVDPGQSTEHGVSALRALVYDVRPGD